ncbi:RNA polymerase sigma factor [Candidatus Bathyarchaeota archaeon]|nr:RNA polymerase sigma factor [Candidatus Bathyarchaeota archaeon]
MPESIERILEALAPRLRSELNGLGYSAHSPDRDDLLQEILIRTWKALKDREGEIQYLNAYVKKIVFSVFINEVNRLRRERQLISAAENRQRLENEDKEDCAGSDEVLKEIIVESLTALGGTKRRVIELRLEGYTLAEIAQLNDWSIGKTCNDYYRGIKELKHRLAKRGIYYED